MEKVAVILAGGIGERFWPISTEENPKQFLQIYNNKPLIENTFLRLKKVFNQSNIFIITNKKYVFKTYEILKKYKYDKLNILTEPSSKNTAPAVLYTSLFLQKKFKESIVFYFPADHLITNINGFISDTETAYNFLKKCCNSIITYGIITKFASSEYGYIKVKEKKKCSYKANINVDNIYEVDKFIEKPDISRAKKFHRNKNYYWNSGIFGWNNNLILDLFKKHQNKLYNLFLDKKEKAYQLCEKISIDYAIIEKADNIFMIESSFDWNDVGDWNVVHQIKAKDEHSNYIEGNVSKIDIKNCIIINDKGTVGTIGLKDLIIIKNNDNVLICNKNQLSRLKELLSSGA